MLEIKVCIYLLNGGFLCVFSTTETQMLVKVDVSVQRQPLYGTQMLLLKRDLLAK